MNNIIVAHVEGEDKPISHTSTAWDETSWLPVFAFVNVNELSWMSSADDLTCIATRSFSSKALAHCESLELERRWSQLIRSPTGIRVGADFRYLSRPNQMRMCYANIFSIFKVYDTDPSEIAYCMLGMSCPPSISKGSKFYPTSSWGLSCSVVMYMSTDLLNTCDSKNTICFSIVRKGPRSLLTERRVVTKQNLLVCYNPKYWSC